MLEVEEAMVEVEEVIEEAGEVEEEEALLEVVEAMKEVEEAMVEVDMVLVQTRCLRTTRSSCRGSPPTAVRRTSSSTLAPSELSRLTRRRAD